MTEPARQIMPERMRLAAFLEWEGAQQLRHEGVGAAVYGGQRGPEIDRAAGLLPEAEKC